MIRRLVDDASELVIKAAGGGVSGSGGASQSASTASAALLMSGMGNNGPEGGVKGSGGMSQADKMLAWQLAGLGPGYGGPGGGGGGSGGHAGNILDRNYNRVSAVRQHRLRELAVAKLARAYRIDEIATSVLVMQSASALDDVAAKVLKKTPNNPSALYVHHFHEKIPSRQLSTNTTTSVLSSLISLHPAVPEYYRTRAMTHLFREEYNLAIRDFKMAIMLSKKRRREMSNNCGVLVKKGEGKREEVDWESEEGSEGLLYFLRGSCWHQFAVGILEGILEGVDREVSGGAAGADGEKAGKKKKKKKKKGAVRVIGVNGTADGWVGKGGLPSPPVEEVEVVKMVVEEKKVEEKMITMNERYAKALEPHFEQIMTLARRSVKDYAHFLT
ncbi:hypothetical protein HK097_011522, partial [Rhizophlyctis rosea]